MYICFTRANSYKIYFYCYSEVIREPVNNQLKISVTIVRESGIGKYLIIYVGE